jgi:hypothetical protein
MLVQCYDSKFEIPEYIIDKYIHDFNGLPGSGNREAVLQLRNNIEDIVDIVAEDPEILYDKNYQSEFIQAIAMKFALEHHGILYDA